MVLPPVTLVGTLRNSKLVCVTLPGLSNGRAISGGLPVCSPRSFSGIVIRAFGFLARSPSGGALAGTGACARAAARVVAFRLRRGTYLVGRIVVGRLDRSGGALRSARLRAGRGHGTRQWAQAERLQQSGGRHDVPFRRA